MSDSIDLEQSNLSSEKDVDQVNNGHQSEKNLTSKEISLKKTNGFHSNDVMHKNINNNNNEKRNAEDNLNKENKVDDEEEKDDDDCQLMYDSKVELSKDDQKENLNNDKVTKVEITNSANIRKVVYVEDSEIADDQCGFPEYLKGSVIRGKCIPINKRTWKEINIDGNDAILDCASQIVPLMIKKPDVFPLKLADDGEDEPLSKRLFTDDNKEGGIEIVDENQNSENGENLFQMDYNNYKNNKSLLMLQDFYKSSVGNFLVGIGFSRVKEWIHKDTVKQLNKKKNKYGETDEIIEETKKQQNYLAQCKSANKVFSFELHKCHMCDFKTESATVLEGHYFIPHISNRKEYKCNFCLFLTKDPRAIISHFQVTHRKQCVMEIPPQLYECPTCPYESSQKAKAMNHFAKCLKTFDQDKVCFISENEAELATITPKPITQNDLKLYDETVSHFRNIALANNLRTPFTFIDGLPRGLQYQIFLHQQQLAQQARLARLSRPSNGFGIQMQTSSINNDLLMQTTLQQQHQNSLTYQQQKLLEGNNVQLLKQSKLSSNASTPITIPRSLVNLNKLNVFGKGTPTNEGLATKSGTFVICEICDGYIKDLEQLRTHMQWIHKVKIHPKMLASRPPLNCQKCQWRFFTDQGLERHLLGAHGLVTSNMQDLVDQNLDGGRCTICGRVFANKLVSHMNQVHKITLRPAHLSYKCTVCSATFNLYRLFESHVYMVHSGSIKRSIMEKA